MSPDLVYRRRPGAQWHWGTWGVWGGVAVCRRSVRLGTSGAPLAALMEDRCQRAGCAELWELWLRGVLIRAQADEVLRARQAEGRLRGRLHAGLVAA